MERNTFGWARAEVLGALVNAVFLIALCFTIFVEALVRMTETEEINDPGVVNFIKSPAVTFRLKNVLQF